MWDIQTTCEKESIYIMKVVGLNLHVEENGNYYITRSFQQKKAQFQENAI